MRSGPYWTETDSTVDTHRTSRRSEYGFYCGGGLGENDGTNDVPDDSIVESSNHYQRGVTLKINYPRIFPIEQAYSYSIASEAYTALWGPSYPSIVTTSDTRKILEDKVNLKINPGSRYSNTFVLDPLATTPVPPVPSPTPLAQDRRDPNWGQQNGGGATNKTTATLNPIQISVKQPQINADNTVGALVSVEEVRFCRWNSPHEGEYGDLVDPKGFPKDDPDRIVISVPLPHKKGQGPLKMHLSTGGAKDTPPRTDEADYNDIGADIELVDNGTGVFESKPITIVADSDDDKWAGGRAAEDGGLNDPTFIAWPGGNLNIKIPELQETPITFPIKKFTHSFTRAVIIAGDINENDDDSRTAIRENLRRLNEIYAPLHERVDFIQEKVGDKIRERTSRLDHLEIADKDNNKDFDDKEVKNWLIPLINGIKPELPSNSIKIVFIAKPYTRDKNAKNPLGVGGQNQVLNGRGDIVLCFLSALGNSEETARKFSAVTPHECGHSLRGSGHSETGGIFDPRALPLHDPPLPKWHLMAAGGVANVINNEKAPNNGKHWYLRDEKIVQSGNQFSKIISEKTE